MTSSIPPQEQQEYQDLQQSNAGGDITIFVETTEQCKKRFKCLNKTHLFQKKSKHSDVSDPCSNVTLGVHEKGYDGGYAEGTCLAHQVADCSCPAAKKLQKMFLDELNGTGKPCDHMIQVTCKPLPDEPCERWEPPSPFPFHKCSHGKYDWGGVWKGRKHHRCDGGSDGKGCGREACSRVGGKRCYTQAQIKKAEVAVSRKDWLLRLGTPRGCDFGSDANTCAYEDLGDSGHHNSWHCVYSGVGSAIEV
jgi:hypothetical protein